MKIIKFKAENFQKLKVVEISPDGNVVQITGKCEQGKTTILDAIHAALGGGKMPAEPIRQGEKKASVEIDLGDMIVTRSFTPAGSSLKIVNKEGFKASKPQDLLDKLVGKLAFDPLEFSRSDSKKQVEMLLGVIDLKIDLPKLKELAGIEFKEFENPLDTLNEAYKEVLENRKLTNRQLDTAKKVIADMPEVEKVDKIPLADLVKEKERLEKQNTQNDVQRRNLENIKYNLVEIKDEAELIKQKILALQEDLKVKENKIKATSITCAELENDVVLLQDADLTDINTRIQTVDETNRQADKYVQRQAKQVELDKFQAESDDYTGRLKKIIDYKNELVKATKFPVEGLDFVGGGINYNGVPFAQSSTAQKLKVSTAIGMAINPKLRVMLIDGAESLDSTQKNIICDMAKDNDYQLWCTEVNENEKVGIYIEDGAVKE